MSYQIESHEAAAIFPLMDGIGLNLLAEDIRAHGLLEPIVLFEGRVLDGRNRLRACELAGVEPRFEDWAPGSGSPIEWVVSHNLHRRHLSVAQRAALALDLLPRLEVEARERQALAGGASPGPIESASSSVGRSDEKAAALVGVGRSTVAAAKAIQKRDDSGEIIDAMRAGELNVEQAAREAGVKTSGQSTSVLDSGDRTSDGKAKPIFFGKGDKWTEASQPLVRYLAAFAKRDYRFGHVNPAEAGKRLKTIDLLIDGLTQARADLEPRSHRARPLSSR